MSFPTVYYITQVIPSCYSAGYAMCVCVSFGACVYRSLDMTHNSRKAWKDIGTYKFTQSHSALHV